MTAELDIQIINDNLFQQITQKATALERRRINHNFHQLPDHAQRFLNAIEPDSYICPHRHICPSRDEAFLVLKGRGAVITFSDTGDLLEIVELNPEKCMMGVDIPGGLYHTIVSLQSGSVFYEVKAGPYDPSLPKGYADWAPEEGSAKAAGYLNLLKKQILSAIGE